MNPSAPRIGRWLLAERLGAGGMGAVWRGVDQSGGEAAIKLLHRVDAVTAEAMRREIRVLSRLRHPGVVRILESGVDDGQPWYAMDLLRGEGPASGPESEVTWVEGALPGMSPRAPAIGLEVLVRLCDVLAWVHGEGVVHRDLKPGNLLIVGGRPILVDFGISAVRTSGRESLESPDRTGTPAYMAPEQIRGEPVDARADLYSFGCLLYASLTGKPPFTGTPGAVLRAHLEVRPAPPSALDGEVSPELDALALALLAKEPACRPAFAAEVGRRLARCIGAPVGRSRPRLRPVRPRLVGRAAEIARFEVHLEDRHRAAMVLITGSAGSGKTRLLTEFGSLAAQRGWRVVAARAEAASRASLSTLRPVLDAIGAAAGTPAGSPSDRFQAADAAADALIGAAVRPLLVLVDDVQHADVGSVAVLQALAARLPLEMPLLVALTCDDDAATDAARWLTRAPGLERVPLDRLEPEAVHWLAGSAIGVAEAPLSLGAWLDKGADGRPLLAVEMVRTALALRRLAPGRGGWRFPSDLPFDLGRLAVQRLAGLPAPARRVAQALAVLGRRTPVAVVREVAGVSPAGTLDALRLLAGRGLIDDPADDPVRLSHDSVGRALIATLEPSVAAAFHRAAATTLVRLGSPADLPAVAEHLRALADPELRQVLLAAARQLRIARAWEEALPLYREWLHGAEADPSRSEVRLELLFDVLEPLHDLEGTVAEAELLGREARDAGDTVLAVKAARLEWVAWQSRGDAPQMIEAASRGIELALAADRPDLARAARLTLATGRRLLGDVAAAEELQRALVAEGEAARDWEVVRKACMNLANLLIDAGRKDDALALARRGLELSKGDLAAEGYAELQLARVVYEDEATESLALATQHLLRARHRALEARDLRLEAAVVSALASVHQAGGRSEDARLWFTRGAEIQRRVGNRRGEALALVNVALLDLETGAFDPARVGLRRAISLAQATGDRSREALYSCRLAQVEAVAGRLDRAEELATGALATLAASGAGPDTALAHCVLGHIALARRQPADHHLAAATAGPSREANALVAGLRVSCAAAARGEPLRNGFALEALPVGLR